LMEDALKQFRLDMKRSLERIKTIDVHAHIVLSESMHMAGHHGPEIGYDRNGNPWFRIGEYYLRNVKYEDSIFMDTSLRLEAMDEAGIDFQVLSPNPLTYFHYIDAENAIYFCQQHNNALVKQLDHCPDRLAGLAAVPIQDVKAACEELERAVSELGLLGAYIGTDFGCPLDSPQLDIFYEQLVKMDVPLFIHPAPSGIDGPKGDPNLNQYELELLTGFAAQETLAVATLIYGGVLERHPELNICVSHAGGAVAMLIGRLNAAARLRPWVSENLQKDGAFESYLAKIWFDTHVHDQRVLNFVISVLGTDRLVLGTNFAGWDQHGLQGTEEWRNKLGNNAKRLLRFI
jgi:aminocarboxymuconate-semialdehyde decarboxylase